MRIRSVKSDVIISHASFRFAILKKWIHNQNGSLMVLSQKKTPTFFYFPQITSKCNMYSYMDTIVCIDATCVCFPITLQLQSSQFCWGQVLAFELTKCLAALLVGSPLAAIATVPSLFERSWKQRQINCNDRIVKHCIVICCAIGHMAQNCCNHI